MFCYFCSDRRYCRTLTPERKEYSAANGIRYFLITAFVSGRSETDLTYEPAWKEISVIFFHQIRITRIPTHYFFFKHLTAIKSTSFGSICKIWVGLVLFGYPLTQQIVTGLDYLIFQAKQISMGWDIYLYDLTFLK